MRDTDIVNAAEKQKGEEDGGEDWNEEEGESMHICHSMVLQYVDILLDYMGQIRFEHSYFETVEKVYTVVRRSLNSSQKQVIITHYFSK
jgi:hypothetical protein